MKPLLPAKSGSELPDYARRLRERLQSRLGTAPPPKPPDTSCLLLDCSESMSWSTASICGQEQDFVPGVPSRYEQLGKLEVEFRDVRRFYFNDVCEELRPGHILPIPCGGTAMHLAFLTLKSRGITHAVMITDGCPNDPPGPKGVLAAAVGLKLDIFYVGPDPAPDILKQLADKTGGKYGDTSMGTEEEVRKLKSSVRGLLEKPKDA